MSSTVSIGQRFTQLIQHLGLSKNAFAQSLDKTATVIQHLVDERNKPGYDLLCKVFETYPNVSKDWLLLGQGPMLLSAVPVPPTVAATAPITQAPTPTNLLVSAPVDTVSAPISVVEAPPMVAEAVPAVSVATAEPALVAPTSALMPADVGAPTPRPPAAASPDANYLAVALQTQYLQHQLALAEQRNQHLLEQQALMQQMLTLLQRPKTADSNG